MQRQRHKKIITPAISVLIGTILIKGFAGSGINMTSSLFLPYVSEDLSVGIGTLSVFFSIASAVMMIWLPFAGRLIQKYNIRPLVITASAFQGLSFASLGLFNNVMGWYIMTVPQTMGAAILVNLLGPIMINRYFPDKTGTVLGIQMAAVWLFAAVLQPTVSNVIENWGWRQGYFFMGISAFVVICASTLIFLRNKAEMQTPQDSEQEKLNRNAISENDGASKVRETLTGSFYLLLIFVIALTGVAAFTQHIPSFADFLGYSPDRVGALMAFASVGGAVGALAIGFVSDRVGVYKACIVVIALWFVAIVGFLFSANNITLFAISCFLHGVSSSCIAVIPPILTVAFYGKTNYEKTFSKVALGAPIASILLIPAYGFVYDVFGSYTPVLIGLFVLLIISGASITWGFKKRRFETE